MTYLHGFSWLYIRLQLVTCHILTAIMDSEFPLQNSLPLLPCSQIVELTPGYRELHRFPVHHLLRTIVFLMPSKLLGRMLNRECVHEFRTLVTCICPLCNIN